MTTKTYTILGDACELRVEVIPTMQALGDQPWEVFIYDLGDGLCLNCDSNHTFEAPSALQAATEAVDCFLEHNGLPTSYSIN